VVQKPIFAKLLKSIGQNPTRQKEAAERFEQIETPLSSLRQRSLPLTYQFFSMSGYLDGACDDEPIARHKTTLRETGNLLFVTCGLLPKSAWSPIGEHCQRFAFVLLSVRIFAACATSLLSGNTRTGEWTRAEAQSAPSSEGRDELSWRNYSPLFSDLCGLGVFARDIPAFGCGPAALG
jgi:hypothetical protein